jgi:hypothetical protein
MKSIIWIISFVISFSALGSEQEVLPTKSGLYDVGGFKIYLECYENDKPQLILEQDFGRSVSDRDLVVKNIKKLVGI